MCVACRESSLMREYRTFLGSTLIRRPAYLLNARNPEEVDLKGSELIAPAPSIHLTAHSLSVNCRHCGGNDPCLLRSPNDELNSDGSEQQAHDSGRNANTRSAEPSEDAIGDTKKEP
jgi:hypothetical protein